HKILAQHLAGMRGWSLPLICVRDCHRSYTSMIVRNLNFVGITDGKRSDHAWIVTRHVTTVKVRYRPGWTSTSTS
ncbi:MAG: hypothetical protein WAU95_06305, partial [Anaerolineae bacterium]